MTQDEIIEMAIQAGIPSANVPSLAFGRVETGIELLESFAKLVAEKAAAKEREACLKLAEKYQDHWTIDAIRARGEA